MDTFIFYIPVTVFWILHILRRDLFWLYFWQKRGSHFNRFFNGLKENKTILFSKSAIFSLVLILFYPLIIKINNLFGVIVLSFYLILGGYSLYLFLGAVMIGDFRSYFLVLPNFKKRIIIFFILIIILEGSFLYILLGNFLKSFNDNILYLSFLIFEVLFSLFFVFSLFLLKLILFIPDKISERKAKNKIEKLEKLVVIGISGSYGKTATKNFLYKILSQKYKVLKTEGGKESREEIVNLINKKLNKNHDFFICEISAFRVGDIKKICNIVRPHIGIITGISEDRISLFGNLKNIINTKYELIHCLPEEGIAIFNVSEKESQKLYQRTNIKKYSYSSSEEKGDVFSKNTLILEDSIEFDFVSWKGEEKIKLNFFNQQYLESFLGAATCALVLDIELPQIKKVSGSLKVFGNYLKEKKGIEDTIIIDDTSNKKPDGFFEALDLLKKYPGRKVVIASSLLELGKSAYAIHNNIGKKIGEICDFAIITSPLFFREIKLGAVSSGMNEKKIVFLRHPQKIFRKIERYLSKGNVFLLEGDVLKKIKEYLLSNNEGP